jgi:hypothetical protein
LMDVVEAVHAKAFLLKEEQPESARRDFDQGYQHAMEYAAEVAEHLGMLETTSLRVKNRLFDILQAWAGFGLASALVAARNVRTWQ